MDTLIKSVVPSTGFYCLFTVQDRKITQKFYSDIDTVIVNGGIASDAGKNAYYAMASFTEGTDRKQTNVALIKSFWLDVDCKNKNPEQDYATKAEGLDAIRDFCKLHKLPKPWLVDSGNGWHVYWALTEAITKAEWQPIANKLKEVCLRGGLRIDPACTADSARILRIPDTINYNSPTHEEVTVIFSGGEVDFEAFSDKINGIATQLGLDNKLIIQGTPPQSQLSAATRALIDNSTSSFAKIMRLSANEVGCGQLLYAYENQETLSEPYWRSALSIANSCSDRDVAIVKLSENHPGYSWAATDKKARLVGGPHLCTTFATLDHKICDECPNKGKVTTPISLGREVKEVTEPVQVSVIPAPAPVIKAPAPTYNPTEVNYESDVLDVPRFAVDTEALDTSLASFEQGKTMFTIPVPPKPFVRGAGPGIFKRMKNEVDGTFDDVLIYENDFYVYARLFDPIEGQVLSCRLHLPMDGVRAFNIPLRSVTSRDELRRIVGSQGIAVNEARMKEIGNYLLASATELQNMTKEEKARTQMGWQEDGAFVIGPREYSANGLRTCPPSSATQNYQHMFRLEGDLATWRKVVDVYKKPGFGTHQFVFFYMLSSPLLQIMGHPGMMASLISDESGVGKSTLGFLCNSVWGHPVEMTSMPHDTINAMVNRMGVFNSLGVYIDELTNKAPEVISDSVYMSTHGRGKERLASSANIERVNNTKWAQNTLASANASLRDKIASLKASSEGENMRLFEFDMRGTPVISKHEADLIFPLIKTNYGVAGHVWASWLVQNHNTVFDMVSKIQRQLDRKYQFTSKERNWSMGVACAYATAFITKSLGIHDYDIEANIDYMSDKIDGMRAEVVDGVAKHEDIISDFLTENHGHVLVIDGLPDANGLYPPPRNKNINKIIARYEPDVNRLYIPISVMRGYCAKRQFSFNSFLLLTGATKDRKLLGARSGVVSGAVRVLVFDTKLMELDIASMTNDGDNDGSSE